ncbi:MAG TPA: hypothetical protein VNY29_17825, partial [Terriglobales bacterium]|nr:hypothetical protein [Terriglobales bacterium]
MADQGIDVGDAVLTFLGDTTQLDTAFARVQAGAATSADAVGGLDKQFVVAASGAQELGTVTNLAGEQVRASMYEARGEVGLLGEEFGIRLPRHVRSFVAELPGVGEALTAAFSATAVLFLLQALVEGTSKLVDFIDHTFIMTKAMEESNAQIAETNKTLQGQQKELEKLQLEYELAGLKGVAKFRKELELLNDTLGEGKRKFEDVQKELDHLKNSQGEFEQKFRDSQGVFSTTLDTFKAFIGKQTSDTDAYYKKTGELQDELLVARKQNEITQKEIDIKEVDRKLAQQELDEKGQKLAEKIWFEIAKARVDAGKIIEKEANDESKITSERLAAGLKAEEKTSAEKIKLIKEAIVAIVEELSEEEAAIKGSTDRKAAELKRQYATGRISGKQYLAQVKELYNEEVAALIAIINKKEALLNTADAKDLAKLKKLEDQKIKIMETAAAKVEEAMIKQNQLITQTSNAAAAAVVSSVAAVVTGAETMTQALGKITQAILDSIAHEAEAQGAKQLALAAGSYPDFAGMAHHFESATLWFALAGGLSAAGSLAGGAGGSGGGQSNASKNYGSAAVQSGSSFSSGPAGGTGINIQKFGGGALVTAPTLAVVGDSKNGGSGAEAVLPLEDDRAMDAIADRIGSRIGGSGVTIHQHIEGVISGDNLAKVVDRINRKVNANQLHLESSNTRRVT